MEINRSYPQRKRLTYELPTILWSIILQFTQASSNETKNELSNFQDMDDFIFEKRYIKQLKQWTIWYKKHKRYYPKFLLRHLVKKDLLKVFSDISQHRYPRRKSIYDWQIEVNPDKARKRALYNTDSYLAEKCNCSIEEVRNILTDEQIGFILDNSKRDYYETFDAWKSINDDILRINNRQLSESEKEILENMKAYKEREKIYKQEREKQSNLS